MGTLLSFLAGLGQFFAALLEGALAIVGGEALDGFCEHRQGNFRVGGYGFPISDEGSGADVGLHAIRLALRAYDERAADSGRNIRCYFCPDCGSTVYWEGDIYPTICGIAVGAFADPDFPPPTFSIWEEALHSWSQVPTVTAHYPQGRPAS